jgi:putative ABC transport system substrate-binding protein
MLGLMAWGPAYTREALAQNASKAARLTFLGLGSRSVVENRVASLRQGLSELGYREGREYALDVRAVSAEPGVLSGAAEELTQAKPDILITHAGGAAALKRATQTIPIVMVSGDAVAAGLVESLQRPGGNITGISFLSPELMAKRLEILSRAVPGIEDVGLLVVAGYRVTGSVVEAAQEAARSLKIRVHPVSVSNPQDLQRAFADFVDQGARGIVVQDEPMLIANGKQIVELSAAARLVSVGFLELAGLGGHMAYSIDFDELYRRAAQHVVKILQGAKPGDLPVEQPTKFRLLVNAKAMMAFGVPAPPTLVALADEVIE